jgi:hypothetical protein
MNSEQQIEQLDKNMVEAKKFMDIRSSYHKLVKNKEFKEVILEYYFNEEAARLVTAKSSGLDDKQEKMIDNMMYGIGALQNFFESVEMRAMQAEQAYKEDEDSKTDIIAEGLI